MLLPRFRQRMRYGRANTRYMDNKKLTYQKYNQYACILLYLDACVYARYAHERECARA